MIDDLDQLKKTYKNIKEIGDEPRVKFLESIVSYCRFIGFDNDKTMMMLALIRNVIPSAGQSWNTCERYDDVDIEFNKKIMSAEIK